MIDRALKYLMLFLGIFSGIGCDGNYSKVTVRGIVLDSNTNVPVEGAEIKVVCWIYDIKKWHSVDVEKVVRTDQNGKFNVNFDKGEAIHIIIDADKYHPTKDALTLRGSLAEFKIYLNPN
jgi:hypothetical protein